MLGKNITIKGIFTAILFITIGFSQVSLKIDNVNTDNPSCTDSQYTSQSTCEAAATCTCPLTPPEDLAACEANSADQESCESHAGGFWSPQWSTGTLDIYMSNSSACSYCSDSNYSSYWFCSHCFW